jgi:hypothetical protein
MGMRFEAVSFNACHVNKLLVEEDPFLQGSCLVKGYYQVACPWLGSALILDAGSGLERGLFSCSDWGVGLLVQNGDCC